MQREVIEQINNVDRKATITVTAAEVELAFISAEREVAKLAGRPLGPKQVGEDPQASQENAIAVRATRLLATQCCQRALQAHSQRLASNPQIDVQELAVRGQEFVFQASYAVVPELSLSDINNICVQVPCDLEVSDEDVVARMAAIQQRSCDETKNSQQGIGATDAVSISFTSTIDDKSYDGSTVEQMDYQLGSLDLPEQFEAGLLGMRAGENRIIQFVIPANFANPEIAGSIACFNVQVNSVTTRRLPELNDQFAQSFGYQDMADWRAKLHCDIAREKQNIYDLNCEKRAREELASRLQGEIPEQMVAAQTQRMLEALKQELSLQQINFSQYCQYLNTNEENIKTEMQTNAKVMLRENLALESLFRQLGVQIDEAQLEKTIQIVSVENNMAEPMQLATLSLEQRNAMTEMTMQRIATEWLLENAVFVSE
jgi:trigger factor